MLPSSNLKFPNIGFDTVDLSTISLRSKGLGNISVWFSSFLKGRVQTTQIDKQISSKRNMLTRVDKARYYALYFS